MCHRVLGLSGYLILKRPSRVATDFMDIDVTEMYLIQACSWRRAQEYGVPSSGIGPAVLEESAIET